MLDCYKKNSLPPSFLPFPSSGSNRLVPLTLLPPACLPQPLPLHRQMSGGGLCCLSSSHLDRCPTLPWWGLCGLRYSALPGPCGTFVTMPGPSGIFPMLEVPTAWCLGLLCDKPSPSSPGHRLPFPKASCWQVACHIGSVLEEMTFAVPLVVKGV